MDVSIVRQLIKDRGYNINTLSKSIGMSHVGLSKALTNGTISVDALEKISGALGVTPCYFFLPLGVTQPQEAKFEYLKDEIFGKTSIKLQTEQYIKSLFDYSLLLNYFESIEKNLSEFAKTEIINHCGYEKGRAFHFEPNQDIHSRIAVEAIQYIIQSEDPVLKNIIRGEYKRIYIAFAWKVSFDPAIMFLIREKMLSYVQLLMEIEHVILSIFNFTTNMDLQCLEFNFSNKDLKEGASYIEMIRKRVAKL